MQKKYWIDGYVECLMVQHKHEGMKNPAGPGPNQVVTTVGRRGLLPGALAAAPPI